MSTQRLTHSLKEALSSSSKLHNEKMHKNYNYVFCSSEAYKDHLKRGFGVDKNIIKTSTLPRIDLLNDKKKSKR